MKRLAVGILLFFGALLAVVFLYKQGTSEDDRGPVRKRPSARTRGEAVDPIDLRTGHENPVVAAGPASAPSGASEAPAPAEPAPPEKKAPNPPPRKTDPKSRKMPYQDLVKELDLDTFTQARLAETLNAAKKAMFDVLRVPRPDGTSLADEMVDSLFGGNPAKAEGAFLKMFTERIPGTDTTYLSATSKIERETIEGDVRKILTPEAFAGYTKLKVQLQNVDTGYDPWVDYYQQRGIDPSKLPKNP